MLILCVKFVCVVNWWYLFWIGMKYFGFIKFSINCKLFGLVWLDICKLLEICFIVVLVW